MLINVRQFYPLNYSLMGLFGVSKEGYYEKQYSPHYLRDLLKARV